MVIVLLAVLMTLQRKAVDAIYPVLHCETLTSGEILCNCLRKTVHRHCFSSMMMSPPCIVDCHACDKTGASTDAQSSKNKNKMKNMQWKKKKSALL